MGAKGTPGNNTSRVKTSPKMPTTTKRWGAYIRRSRAISWSSQRRSYEASTSPLAEIWGRLLTLQGVSICRARELVNASRFDYASTSAPFCISESEIVREQSPPLQNRREIRPHLHRHRRLDVRAMARRVLSRKTCPGQRAAIRGFQAHLDRDQRHLLRFAKTGKLSQMGARGARRLCVLVERPALCHQPPRAGGGRRFREAVLRFRRARTRRPPRPRAVAVRADQEIRRSGFRQIPRASAARTRRKATAPCGRGPPRQLLRAGLRGADQKIRNARGVRRARQVSGDR